MLARQPSTMGLNHTANQKEGVTQIVAGMVSAYHSVIF